MTGAALAYEEVFYPESDAQPVSETQFHYDESVDLIKPLEGHFENDADVWVAGNLFVYYVKGDPAAVVSPDVLVVRGVEKKKRRKYLLWEEGIAPCFVIELTSKSTWQEDTGRKKQKYARLGVAELFLFDVLGEYLQPNLQGFRLMSGSYRQMRPLPDGSLHSRTLGLTLKPEGAQLRLVDSATGELLLRVDEERQERREAVRRADQAQQRAEQAQQRAEQAEQGLRRNIEDVCDLLGIEWSAVRRDAVAGMDSARLETLWTHLMSRKRWP